VSTDLSTQPKPRQRDELRGFLRNRRARLTPDDVGLPSTGRRRTPGLRREEVAFLAGVGVSWYTWLEQGRNITVSDSVIDAISGALRLSDDERAHLYVLAGLNPPVAAVVPPTSPVAPLALRRLLQTWMPHPAYIRDGYWNILARNDSVDRIFGYGDHDNCLLAFFTRSPYRDRHADWQSAAGNLVAELRARLARHPDDAALGELVDQLHADSREFTALWSRHDVRTRSQGTKPINHPDVGLLVFDHTMLTLPDHPDLRVVLHTPSPGTDTEDKLARLR
jgi:hypothetical protein